MTATVPVEHEGELALDSRWWVISLVGVSVAIVAIAALELEDPADARPVVLTLITVALYLLFVVTVTRTALIASRRAWLSVIVTIVAAGLLTAITPGNAVFQFWMYPFIWVLTGTPRAGIVASFFAALAVFFGFGASTSEWPSWVVSALVTQCISYAVNVVLGLWISGVYRYAGEREALLAELTAAQDELAALHRDAGTTAERERLSRELHDTIAQSLAGTVMLAQRARREFAAGELDAATLEIVEDAARTALAETRALVVGTAPVELRGGGIAEALEGVAARFTRETGVPVAMDVDAGGPLEREVEVALLRCAQEALANVRRHAGARHVRVALRSTVDAVEVRVVDDGRGFDPAAATWGFGLGGLRSRLALLGGTIDVDGAPGAATLVARVPRVAEGGAE